MSSTTKRDLVIASAAISAGVHAALAPEHFAASRAKGVGFAAGAMLLALVVFGVGRWPAGAAILFTGLLASYAVAVANGEPIDALAIGTKVVELIGLVSAVGITRGRSPQRVPWPALGVALLIGVFSAQVALALSAGHHHA